MKIKLELIQSHIAEMVKKMLEDNIIDYSTIADTNAIIILDEIKKIIADDSLTDFDVVARAKRKKLTSKMKKAEI